MKWIRDFRRDVRRYTLISNGSPLKQILTEQGLWAMLQYRIEAAAYRCQLPGWIKVPLRFLLTVSHKIVEIITGISLSCAARIGPGLYLPHCGMRVVNSSAIIGENCCVSHGVTIGVSGRGEKRGVPIIGDRVYLGVNAVVVGKISVGDDVVIGANSLVNRNVPSHCTSVGVPAVVINNKGSKDYIFLGVDHVAAEAFPQVQVARVINIANV